MFGGVTGKLRELKQLYGEFLQIAEGKQQILQKNDDSEALRQVTAQEEAFMARAAAIERERMAMVGAIAKEHSLDADGLTVSKLVQLAPSAQAEELAQAAAELAELLGKLQRQNAINRQLLEINMSFATFMLDSISANNTVGSTYDAGGTEYDPERTNMFLDSEI